MGPRHLNAAKAETVYDLGMGTGKVAMQVFLQFPNLSRVYGIELSQARFELGEAVRATQNKTRESFSCGDWIYNACTMMLHALRKSA